MPAHQSSDRRPAARLGALVLAGALLVCACRQEPARRGEGRGVLLIAVDALRADHLSGSGYDRATTPTLDALGDAGVRFENHLSTAPWNLPATASLLTGCDPYVSRRLLPAGLPRTLATRWSVPEQAPHLAQQFLLSGWTTAAFVDHADLAPLYGFDAGFQTWTSTTDLPAGEVGLAALERPLVQWLRERGHDENWFAFVHSNDLERTWELPDPRWDTVFAPRPELSAVPPVGDARHLFHAVPRARWSGGLSTLGEYRARYDGALLRLDGEVGRLLNQLAQLGWLDDTSVCLVGTHGLGFGEAGLWLDHGTLDDVDLAVPWILKPAGDLGLDGGRSVRELSSALDVAPTLLDLVGLDVPAAMHGVSFLPFIGGRARAPRDHLVARNAFQDGYAVLDAHWRLELLQPWRVDDEILASSWFGHGPPFPEEVRVRLVPRAGAAAPELDAAGREQLIERLCGQGRAWVRDVEGLRASLQTAGWLNRAGFAPESDVTELGPCAR
jgi:arylsulfatase A-like enzyme